LFCHFLLDTNNSKKTSPIIISILLLILFIIKLPEKDTIAKNFEFYVDKNWQVNKETFNIDKSDTKIRTKKSDHIKLK